MQPWLAPSDLEDAYVWDLDAPDNCWSGLRFWRALGYADADVRQGMAGLQAAMWEPDRAALEQERDQALHEPGVQERLLRFRHRAGHALWFRSRAFALRDLQGTPHRVVGLRTQLSEPRLIADESLLSIVEALPVPVLGVDRSFTIRLANSRASHLLGYAAAALTGESWSRLGPTDAISGASPGSTAPRALELVRRDGQRLHVEVVLSSVRTLDGPLALISVDELSGRRRAHSDKDRLAAIVEASEDAVLSMQVDGTILTWNQAAERLFGFSREEVLGRTLLSTIVPEAQAEEEREALRRVATGEAIAARDTIRINRDRQEMDVSVSLAPLRDESGQVVAISAIVRDMRAKRARDRELQRSNAELEQFAYIASHDLQEPLRAVASYTELLARKYGNLLDEAGLRYVRYTTEGAHRMQQLVNDLLAYSRVGSNTQPPAEVALVTALQAALANLSGPIAESGATIEAAPLPVVQGIGTQLTQLFQNLIGNAIKYRAERPLRVTIRCESSPDAHLISVADNGIGFDMTHAGRLFQMFQRLHERGKYPGSGIGLAISKRIVERHGGRIWAESEPGTGSAFHFTLARQWSRAANGPTSHANS